MGGEVQRRRVLRTGLLETDPVLREELEQPPGARPGDRAPDRGRRADLLPAGAGCSGYYPGFNGSYWANSTVYNRDRALFKQYMPLIKKIIAAGWRPITYATPSDPAIHVERFDDQVGNTFYLTAQNSSTATKSFQMTVDGAVARRRLRHHHPEGARRQHDALRLSLRLQHPLLRLPRRRRNRPLPDDRVRTDRRRRRRRPWILPTNGSFESGSGSPTDWTLGTSVTDGTWSWDRNDGPLGNPERQARGSRERSTEEPGLVVFDLRAVGGQDLHPLGLDEELERGGILSADGVARGAGFGGKHP